MINSKTIIGVVIVAALIGVLYVVFEKNFISNELKLSANKPMSNSQTSSAQELSKSSFPQQSPLISLPSPKATIPPITETSDLENEASNLEMLDYSSSFEELKSKAQK